jgi:hypothetical protein
MIILLCLLTQAERIPSGLELVGQVPLPVVSNSSYAYAAIPAKAPSDSIVFTISAPFRNAKHELATFRFDAATKNLTELQGIVGSQKDCGTGIASVPLFEDSSTRVIDIATGKLLSTIGASIDRVGVLGIERLSTPESRSSDMLRVWDVRTGKELTQIAQFSNGPNYIGHAAWDDGSLRMFASQRTVGDKYGAGYILYRAKGSGFERGESVTLFESWLGFDRIVGNPSQGPFAAQISTNRRVFYVTLTKDLKKTKFQVQDVHDVNWRGVLGRMITKENEYVDPDLGPIGCWDPMTGKKLWQLTENDQERAIWLDRCALVGEDLRHPSTGEVVIRLPKDRMFIAARGDTIWLLTNDSARQLEVWRVR